MNLSDFARFFIRFNGVSFVFWAIYTAIDLPPYIRNYRIVHEVPGADNLAAEDLMAVVIKIVIQLLAAFLLLCKTDPVISLLTKGQWRPIQPPEPTHESDA